MRDFKIFHWLVVGYNEAQRSGITVCYGIKVNDFR